VITKITLLNTVAAPSNRNLGGYVLELVQPLGKNILIVAGDVVWCSIGY
jgi:hypothetical protein